MIKSHLETRDTEVNMSFDHNAWVERGAQRQQIIERLEHRIYREGEASFGGASSYDAALLEVGIALIKGAAKRRSDSIPRKVELRIAIFVKGIYAKVDREARNPEEAAAMIVELGKKMIDSGTNSFVAAFNRKESEMFGGMSSKSVGEALDEKFPDGFILG